MNTGFKCAIVAAAALFAMPVHAATVGVAVDAIGSSNGVGDTEYRGLLGGDAIEYYIPLSDDGSCTFGVDCGVSSDTGRGGTEMSMFLRFDGLSTTSNSTLRISFEDLDLYGVNDPWWFSETVELLDDAGDSLTGLISNISSSYVTGNHDTQQFLSFDLGVLDSSTQFFELSFTASSHYYARNTPEYLVAEISSVPLPAAGFLLLGGLAGLGLAKRRKS